MAGDGDAMAMEDVAALRAAALSRFTDLQAALLPLAKSPDSEAAATLNNIAAQMAKLVGKLHLRQARADTLAAARSR